MKLACIVPMKDVEHTYDGDYAMLLAHLADYYPDKTLCGRRNCYTIMDNSLIELGGAVTIKEVYEAARKCNANEMILPDVFKDGKGTVRAVYESLEWLHMHGWRGTPRLMAVAQGSNSNELAECFRTLEHMPEVHCIGIPKVADTICEGGRASLEYIWMGTRKNIHLLGCWTSLNEFRTGYEKPELIRSADTCLPALQSIAGFADIKGVWGKRPDRPINLVKDTINWTRYRPILNTLKEADLL